MSPTRQELDSELQALIQLNHLAELLPTDTLDSMSDSSMRALLMQVRAHRDVELCLARDALSSDSRPEVDDFTNDDMDTVMRVWGGN
jgi:hypothetical protein